MLNSRMEAVRHYLAAQRDAHLERVRVLLRQPSISSEDRGLSEAAALLAQLHRDAGFDEVEILETSGYPAVYGYLDAQAPITIGVYGYYDTNVVGSGWTREPFAAELGSAGHFPHVVFGVGVATKASYVAWLNALEALRKTGSVPVNVVALIEGEEWVGSTHVAELIERKRDRFERAHSVVWPGFAQTANGEARVALGTKGFLHLKLSVSAERWGRGPMGAVHGSAQGVLDSPSWRLIDALSTMARNGGTEIRIDGFGEGIHPPSAELLALTRELLKRYAEKDLADVIPGIDGASKIKRFAKDLSAESLLMRYLFAPTLNLSGVAAGYTGPGSWQYGLPSRGFCTIDIRMPPGMEWRQTLAALRGHLDRHGFEDIEIEVLAAYGSSQSLPSDAVVRAAVAALAEHGLDPVLWPRRGSSGPLGIFSDVLRIPTLSGFGVGHATQTGPDTYYVVEKAGSVGGLLESELSFASFVDNFARLAAAEG